MIAAVSPKKISPDFHGKTFRLLKEIEEKQRQPPNSEKFGIPSMRRGSISGSKVRSSPWKKNIMCSFLGKRLRSLRNPFQLDLFSPNSGVYEYSAVVTDTKQWDAKELLLFVSGRSGQENSLSELKDDFAFGYAPAYTYQANSAYFQVSQMAYNLSLSLQHEMGLVKKHSTNPKKTRFYQGWKWKTFRFLILNRAGREGSAGISGPKSSI